MFCEALIDICCCDCCCCCDDEKGVEPKEFRVFETDGLLLSEVMDELVVMFELESMPCCEVCELSTLETIEPKPLSAPNGDSDIDELLGTWKRLSSNCKDEDEF